MSRPSISRRELLLNSLPVVGGLSLANIGAHADSLHCTPSPEFSVPLTAGDWHSAPFPVGKHDYHVWLYVDRTVPLDTLDCDLGPPRVGKHCDVSPLLDVEWQIWDGPNLVKSWPSIPIRADSWAQTETGCMLGNFRGRSNGTFSFAWNVKKDGGSLKALHPRIQIIKNPGYWCWL